MILIAHRGNIGGPNPTIENSVPYLKLALAAGYDIEADVWYVNGWYLGHDAPQRKFELGDISSNQTWFHAKNREAFQQLVNTKHHYFWHQNDDYVLTSKGYSWVYKSPLHPKCISVLPEHGYDGDLSICDGICSDYVERY